MPLTLTKDDREPKRAKPTVLSTFGEELKVKKVKNENIWQSTLAFCSMQKVSEEIVSINQRWSRVKGRIHTFLQAKFSRTNLTNDVNDFKLSPISTLKNEPQEENSGVNNPGFRELLPSLMAM